MSKVVSLYLHLNQNILNFIMKYDKKLVLMSFCDINTQVVLFDCAEDVFFFGVVAVIIISFFL